jgi:hypothetical protein
VVIAPVCQPSCESRWSLMSNTCAKAREADVCVHVCACACTCVCVRVRASMCSRPTSPSMTIQQSSRYLCRLTSSSVQPLLCRRGPTLTLALHRHEAQQAIGGGHVGRTCGRMCLRLVLCLKLSSLFLTCSACAGHACPPFHPGWASGTGGPKAFGGPAAAAGNGEMGTLQEEGWGHSERLVMPWWLIVADHIRC